MFLVSALRFHLWLRSRFWLQRIALPSSMQQLRVRLGCSKLLLESVKGQPSFGNASKIQGAAFAEIAKDVKLASDEAAELSDLAVTTGFAPPDLNAVLDALAKTASDKKRI